MSGLHGHLDLLAAPDATGKTILRRQSFAPPYHISKPHRDGGWLVVNLASPSPGLLAGDRIEARVEVANGARLSLTAPSASRIHTMREGAAGVVQEFHVADGGWFEFFPEYLIPQSGASYRQRSIIHLAPGATMLWCESVAPGRTARGECFAYRELRIATDVWQGATQIMRERYRLTTDSLAGMRKKFPTGYYASLIAAGPDLSVSNDLLRELSVAHDEGCWIGLTRISSTALAVKLVASESPTLRSMLGTLRARLHAALGGTTPDIRRITGTNLI